MTEAHITIEDLAQSDATKVAKLITIVGQLDESNVDEKAQEIYALITANPQGLHLIFDFGGLEYMNSKSIGYLTDWFGKVTETQGKIAIIKAKPNIIDILEVIGLTQLIPMFASLDEAKFAILTATATPTPTPATSEPVLSMPSTTPAPVVPAMPPVPPAPPEPTVTTMPSAPVTAVAPTVTPAPTETPVLVTPVAPTAPTETTATPTPPTTGATS
jgi:anti-anti-sigma factor